MSTISEGLLLDTHTWLWMQDADPRIGRSVVRLIDHARAQMSVYVSAISVWEIGNLEQAGRVVLNAPIEEWLALGYGPGLLQLIEVESKIACASTRLPGNIHRDPADRILAATARLHNLTLMTNDRQLLAYAKQGHLKARPL